MSYKGSMLFILFFILTFTLSACSAVNPPVDMSNPSDIENTEPAPAVAENTDGVQTEKSEEAAAVTPKATSAGKTAAPVTEDQAGDTPVDQAANLPDWFNVELTDVRSGEAFTIQGFQGKVVLVETMAIWCSNCRIQQENVADLHTLLGEREDFISLGLDIDPNEDAASLKAYIEKNGFHWTYAVVPIEVGRDLANLYGSQYLNPPSTPMLIIDKEGSVHLLPFGIKSPQQLQEALEPFLSDSV